MFKLFFLLFGIILSVSGQGLFGRNTEFEDESPFVTMMSFLRLARGLSTPGSPCSYRAETLRQSYAQYFMNNPTDSFGLFGKAKAVVRNNEPLCNAESLLICSNSTNTCVCGDPSYEILNFPLPPYNLENNKCYRAVNTFCPPVSTEPISKCVSGTACLTVTKEPQQCTMMSAVEYVLRKFSRYQINVRTISKELMKGNICTCQTLNSIDGNAVTNDSEELQGHLRKKRETSNIFSHPEILGSLANHIY